jgi:hypothetical protein
LPGLLYRLNDEAYFDGAQIWARISKRRHFLLPACANDERHCPAEQTPSSTELVGWLMGVL